MGQLALRLFLVQAHLALSMTEPDKYFSSLDPKQPTLYYCDPFMDTHSIFRMPKSLKCIYLTLETQSTAVPITVRVDNPEPNQVTAHHCEGVIPHSYKASFFLGGGLLRTPNMSLYM